MPYQNSPATIEARLRVRSAMPVEADLAFRRRCETIIEWLGNPQPGQTILDCGSGYGFILRLLLELTPSEIVGLEYQQERIDATRAMLGDHPRLTLARGDAIALPFPDAAFDGVVCSEVLEHLPDDARAVRELARVLKPGGAMILTVPAADFPLGWDPPNWALRRFGRSVRGERPWSGIWYGHLRLYTRQSLEALAQSVDLEVVETRGLSHNVPPFAHLLLYGIGKPLLQSGLIPRRFRQQIDRHGSEQAAPSGIAGFAMRILNRIDAPNDDPGIDSRVTSFVAIGLRARKPDSTSRNPAEPIDDHP